MSCKYNNCKHCGYKPECEIIKENAELKEQISTKDIQIKELQEQKVYWKESSSVAVIRKLSLFAE